MVITKRYHGPFVLEKSKLTRLLGVIAERLEEPPGVVHHKFEAQLMGHKNVSSETVDEILQLDNSERSRVVRLRVASTLRATVPIGPRFVEVDFDGTSPATIRVTTDGPDQKWVAEMASVVEEQVERNLERAALARLLSGSSILMVALFGALLCIVSAGISLDGNELRLSRNMWLTQEDLAALREKLRSSKALPADTALDVFNRQIGNILKQQNQSPLATLMDWRVLALTVPVLVIAVCVFWLTRLYPPAVFLWGDVEEWYRRVLVLRSTIWNVVIGALIVGLIANVAVYALGSLLSGRGV
jgi:hypothetical protein